MKTIILLLLITLLISGCSSTIVTAPDGTKTQTTAVSESVALAALKICAPNK